MIFWEMHRQGVMEYEGMRWDGTAAWDWGWIMISASISFSQ
jgi:hypothetical protein